MIRSENEPEEYGSCQVIIDSSKPFNVEDAINNAAYAIIGLEDQRDQIPAKLIVVYSAMKKLGIEKKWILRKVREIRKQNPKI